MKKTYSILARLSKVLTIIFAAILIIASLSIKSMSFDNPSFDFLASLMWASLAISPICGVAWFVFVIKEGQEEEKEEQERIRMQRQSKLRGQQSGKTGTSVKKSNGYSKIDAIWPYKDSDVLFVLKENDKYDVCSVSVKRETNHDLSIVVNGHEYRKAQIRESAILYVSDYRILKLDAHGFKFQSEYYTYIGDVPELSEIFKLNLKANFIGASLQHEEPDVINCAPKHMVHLDTQSMISDLNKRVADNIYYSFETRPYEEYPKWVKKLPIRITEIEKLTEGWLISWNFNGRWKKFIKVLTLQYANGVPAKLSCWTYDAEDDSYIEHSYVELK